jgi:glutamine amidotransferase
VIAVLDYGIGNLRSAEKALQHLGADARLVTDPDEAAQASGIVLPGVGAFGACSAALRRCGLEATVREAIANGTPFLGVCIGLQLLFEGSDEDPTVDGLGIVGGTVRSIPATERRPQMQWNIVRPTSEGGRLLPNGEEWFYFVHSYAPVPSVAEVATGIVAGTCDYGGTVIAAIERGNLFGTQFHPEKSARAGLDLLGRFAALCEPVSAEVAT